MCVECRGVIGRKSPVCLLEICHYLLTINPQESQSVTVSDWRNLKGGSKDGFKAGLTLTSSGTMYQDKKHTRDTCSLRTNGKCIAMARKMYKAVAVKPVEGMSACITDSGIRNSKCFITNLK